MKNRKIKKKNEMGKNYARNKVQKQQKQKNIEKERHMANEKKLTYEYRSKITR